ncbi:hypothetical protein, partial [uncultured Thiodictyon sp.]|uniref:hypothetical protein n=1 Tax=uncultured Thiodictyon sp. TaxID=1846217 RepID=UPI0025DDB907
TYGSALLGGVGSVGLMSIAPGATAPTKIASGCGNVCHTASADGSTLISATGGFGLNSISYDLKSSPPSVIYTDTKQSLVYGGIYPDGSFAMSATLLGGRLKIGFMRLGSISAAYRLNMYWSFFHTMTTSAMIHSPFGTWTRPSECFHRSR